MFFRSLKKEILTFTLGLTIVTIIATATIGISSTQTAGRDASGASSDILRTQAQAFLTQISKAAAQQQDLAFEKIKDNTNVIASYTANMYDNPWLFDGSAYWNFDTRITRKNGRYLNSASDASTVHIPSFVDLNQTERRDIERSANLDFLVPALLGSSPDSVAAYTIDTQGATRYFPNIVLGSLAPPEYDPRPDIYYKPATPAENPDKKIVWSPLYDDVAGRGLMITVTAPVYAKNGFEGIAATDVLLTNIIKTITAYSPVEGSYAFLVDKDGQTIAFSDKAYQDILGRARNEGEGRSSLATTTSIEFSSILKGMTSGEEGFGTIRSGGRELFIAYAPLKQTGFSMAVVAEARVMLKAAGTLDTQISSSVRNNIATKMLPASALIILIASVIGVILVARIVKPIRELTIGAREIGRGNFDYNLTTKSKNEIGELAVSFNHMGQALKKSRQELYEYSLGLEKKVEERTLELTNANQQQENLLHFISHEVKGYFTKSEAGFAAIVEGDYGAVIPQLQSMASAALADMRKGVHTVMDILDASNLKKGTVTFNKKPFDLKTAVLAEVEAQKGTAEEKHLTLDVSISDGDYSFEGDEEKLRQHVVRNLIDNAIKYTPRGAIKIELSRQGETTHFSVQDNGVGITPEDMVRLFTEGGKGKDSIKTNVHSTGYGLYIAKQVVEAHGGTIRAESAGAGKGARFIVELPTGL